MARFKDIEIKLSDEASLLLSTRTRCCLAIECRNHAINAGLQQATCNLRHVDIDKTGRCMMFEHAGGATTQDDDSFKKWRESHRDL